MTQVHGNILSPSFVVNYMFSCRKYLLILLAALLLLIGLSNLVPFLARKADYPDWWRQYSALGELALALKKYIKLHNNIPPTNVAELKEWAIAPENFLEWSSNENDIQKTSQASFWSFKDPDTGQFSDWILCPIQNKYFRAYAPKVKQTRDTVEQRRLVLTANFKTEFISESEFKTKNGEMGSGCNNLTKCAPKDR